MKQLRTILLTFAALVCSTVASAYNFEADGIYYNITNKTTLTVAVTYKTTSYNSYSGNVVIPSTVIYNGQTYSVTSIGVNAFSDCTNLTSVTIPTSVTSIGNYAFSGYSSLTSITIPASVTSIGSYAFSYCNTLTSITIPEGVTSIWDYAFNRCSSLASITIPASVTNIGQYAFYYCSNLASVTFSENSKLTTIGYSAFQDCSNLTSITIPENSKLTTIKNNAFYRCSSLASITLPEGVTSIGEHAFSGCSSLTSTTIPASVTTIGGAAFRDCTGELFVNCNIPSLNNTMYHGVFGGSKFTKVTIGDNVSSIGSYAFNGCSFTSITIPENVVSIGDNVFKGCSSLTSITFPEDSKLASIGGAAFRDCSSLTSITIPEGVTSIGDYAFYFCTNLASVTIPEDSKLTSIGTYAFGSCSSLASITIPENVTSMGDYAFYFCTNLASVTIPEDSKLTSIGTYAFGSCSILSSIAIPEGVTSIGSGAFSGCSSLTSITIPTNSKLTSIGVGAFRDCVRLVGTINLPGGITSIEERTFSGCSSLTSIAIPEGVTSIGSSAFNTCSSLTSITIPENSQLTSIGSSAFYQCSSLTSIAIPEGVTTIDRAAFQNCWYLTSITIPTNSKLTSIGVGAFRDCVRLVGTINLPGGITSIEERTFEGCSSLTSITIPESVTSIGDGAFSAVKEVFLKPTTPPELISSFLISDYTILNVPAGAYDDYCSATYWTDMAANITNNDICVKNLTLAASDSKSSLQVAIGDDNLKYVTDLTISGTINSYDFMIMRNKMPLLRHLNLKDASIVYNAYEHYTGYHTDDNVFPGYGLYNCKLYTLVCPTNITSVGYRALDSNKRLSEVTLFEGVTSIGQTAFQFCLGLTTITIPESVKSIEVAAFYKCSNLTSITFLNGVPSIGDHAFYECSSLASISFLEGTVSLGNQTFYGCTALENVVLPPTVKTISNNAFQNCSKLKEIRIPSSIRSVGDNAFLGCSNLNDVYVYTVEPIHIGQNTFVKSGNNFVGTLHAPKVSYWDYYYNTQWSQFASFAEFDEPYDNFYLNGDKVLDKTTGDIRGDEQGNAPDAEMGNYSGIIVNDDVEQELGDVDIVHNGSNGASIVIGGNGCVNADKLHFRINVTGGRWYFFCFPFDVKAEDIRMEGGANWVFRYYDGAERAKNGKGGWKNVTSDGNGIHLKAATGYIFQCSQDDVLVLTVKDKTIKKENKYNELVEHATQNTHDASWNFVGNPYLSYYGLTADDYSAPLTVWDGSKYIAIRLGDDDYQLAPFEAFFVQKPAGKDKVNYNADRQYTYHGSQKARARRRSQAVDPDRLLVNLTLTDGTATDHTRVVFNNSVSMGYEMACDAAKFSTAGVPQLYTIDSRAVKYAINERPVAEGIVTVGFTAPAEGVYTLSAPRMDTPMLLRDNATGVIHDFAEGSYEFASGAGTFDDRFTVMMKAGETSIDEQRVMDNESPVYNIKGQRVNEATEQGVYIKGDRKVVIK